MPMRKEERVRVDDVSYDFPRDWSYGLFRYMHFKGNPRACHGRMHGAAVLFGDSLYER